MFSKDDNKFNAADLEKLVDISNAEEMNED